MHVGIPFFFSSRLPLGQNLQRSDIAWFLEQDASLVVLETIIGERETVIYYFFFGIIGMKNIVTIFTKIRLTIQRGTSSASKLISELSYCASKVKGNISFLVEK